MKLLIQGNSGDACEHSQLQKEVEVIFGHVLKSTETYISSKLVLQWGGFHVHQSPAPTANGQRSPDQRAESVQNLPRPHFHMQFKGDSLICPPKKDAPIRWLPLPPGEFKLNFDVSPAKIMKEEFWPTIPGLIKYVTPMKLKQASSCNGRGRATIESIDSSSKVTSSIAANKSIPVPGS
ncbi:hypothetical protein AMTR_s00013p00258710 [Amborella trichopoda]|uniref:Uncharacterized protein n=1 Tax=Amborella trichopoda TaxID=13333 RepID=W1PQU4_AMBTC|nr:hypothetical protein AMTR_s00013p00258710 [Amborella trichopoda]